MGRNTLFSSKSKPNKFNEPYNYNSKLSKKCYRNIFGGGESRVTLAIPNIITGNVNLNVFNTQAQFMVGGSSTDGLFSSIAGSLYMNVVNSTAALLYGGCGEVNLAPIGKTFIGESIYLNVTNSNIGTLAGAGSSPGVVDNSIAVQRDVNVFVHNSNITTMLTPVSNFRRNNVDGNVTLTYL